MCTLRVHPAPHFNNRNEVRSLMITFITGLSNSHAVIADVSGICLVLITYLLPCPVLVALSWFCMSVPFNTLSFISSAGIALWVRPLWSSERVRLSAVGLFQWDSAHVGCGGIENLQAVFRVFLHETNNLCVDIRIQWSTRTLQDNADHITTWLIRR